MADVFISYSREDRPRVRGLAEALESRGWDVWWDREIPVGSSFDDVIEEQLESARCVIVVWTARSAQSRWVRAEAGEAVNRGVLLPVLLEETEVPLAFRRIQTASLVDWDGSAPHAGFDQVVGAVARLCAAEPGETPTPVGERTSQPPQPPPAAQPGRVGKAGSKRWLGIAAAVALALVLAVVGYRFLAGGSRERVVKPKPVPAATDGPAAPEEQPRPAEEREAVRVVRVLMQEGGSLASHGFFTPRGLVVIFAPRTDARAYFLTWVERGQRRQGRARVVEQRDDRGRVPYLALLRLDGDVSGAPRPTTRNAASLRPGEAVVRYISSNDQTPGEVIEVRDGFSLGAGRFTALVTSYISGPGDAGAPVLDSNGRIVALVAGGRTDRGESYSIPIESIKLAYQQAF